MSSVSSQRWFPEILHAFALAVVDSAPAASSNLILSKLLDLQSQFTAFQDEVRVSLASIVDQLTLMENRLGAMLNTVEVQTEYIDKEETIP